MSALSSAVTISSRGSVRRCFASSLEYMYISNRGVHRDLAADRIFGILAADQAIAPFEELVAILVRNPEHLRDHLQWKFGCDIGHEIAFTFFQRAIEDLRHHRANRRVQHVDHARSEAAIDQRAIAGVIRRIHGEHHAALRGEILRSERILHRDDSAARLLRGESLAVAVDRDYVIVASDDPEARARRSAPDACRPAHDDAGK